jgi:UPF0755 protein
LQWRLIERQPLLMQDAVIEIAKGDSLLRLLTQLQDRGIALKRFWVASYAHLQQLDHKLKVGEYHLPSGSSAAEVLAIVTSGKTIQYAITFPEGWSLKQILQAVQQHPQIRHTVDELAPTALAQQWGLAHHPEGWLYPDTYFFEKNTADSELLKRAHSKMQQVLNEEWAKRDPQLPLQDSYQALILASIVEKETGASDERSKIAGVFTRRLQKGMLLQTDPTVIYGMGDRYQGDIRYQDLKQATPYNTYINPGLPPTPIAMPGKAAIVAALHPEAGDALYFVAQGNGRHVFSATLAAHQQAVERYQR